MKRLIAGMIIAVVVITPLVPFNTASAATELIVNSGFETQGTAATNAANWTAYNGGYTRTNEAAHSGSFSAKATNANTSTLSGVYQRIDLNQTSLKPVFIGGYVKGNNITPASGSWYGASVYAEIHLTNGQIAYWNSVMNTGTFDWRWIGFNTGTLSTVNAPISHIFIVGILGNASGSAYFDDMSASQHEPTQAAVTLMFDDGEISTYTQAFPVLNNQNFVGSAAIVSNFVSEDGDTGYMTQAQIEELEDRGWDIVSHTVNHVNLPSFTAAEQEAELANSKSTLTSMGFTVKDLALPFGAYNADVLARAAKHYASVRAYELGDNPQGLFPNDVKVRSIINTTTVSEVQSWLNSAQSGKRWEVLVFHSISASGDDQYHVSPATFQAIVQAVKNSGIQVINYNQGTTLFGINPGTITPPPPPPTGTTTPPTGTSTPPTGTTTPPTQNIGAWSFSPTASNPRVVNQPIDLNVGVANSGQVNDAIVDLEVYNSSNTKIHQKFFEHQNISSTPSQFQTSWTPTATGAYTLKIGIFANGWNPLHVWNNGALTINVTDGGTTPPPGTTTPPTGTTTPPTGTTTPPTGTTTPPTSSDITVLTPTEGQTMTGTLPFRAHIPGRELGTYNMFWKVDTGNLVQMYNVAGGSPAPYKEAMVNFTNWKWRGSGPTWGPYKITFVAQETNGTTISQKEVNIQAQ